MKDKMFYIEQHFQTMPDWCQWGKRIEIQGSDSVGAYLLSVCEAAPTQKSNILSKKVVYIGEAHIANRSLMKRWREFERVALGQAKNHSGAKTFRENGFNLKNVWLLAFPVPNGLDCLGSSVLAQLFERELIWHYYNKHGRLPVCNKK